MELVEELERIAGQLGYKLSDEELEDQAKLCRDFEEHIFLQEADMVASLLSASIVEMLRLNQWSPEAIRSCALLRALIIARCMDQDEAFAARVERMMNEAASIIAPAPSAPAQRAAKMH